MASTPDTDQSPSRSPDRPWRVPLLLGAGVLATYLFTAAHNLPHPKSDASLMLAVSHALVIQGVVPIANVDGTQVYCKYGIGQSLLDLPVAWAWERGRLPVREATMWYALIVAILPDLVGAATVVLLYLIALRLGHPPRHALLGALGLAFGTMWWVYSGTPWADLTLGFCWLLAGWAALRYREDTRPRWLAVCAAALGFAVLTKPVALLVIPIIAVYAGWDVLAGRRRPTGREVLAFGLPLLVCALVAAWYNVQRFGSITAPGYQTGRDVELGFDTPLLTGLYGLLLSSGKGIFWYNPILLLAIPGIPRLYRRRPAEAALAAVICLTIILVHARWWAWHGDNSWGPRFLVPLLPWLVLAAMEMLRARPVRDANRRLYAASLGILFAFSVGITLLGIFVPPAPFIRLVKDDIPVVTQSHYDVSSAPIRDDLLATHFIPEFSPIAGHFWMLRGFLAKDDAAQLDLLNHPPWYSLYPYWTVDSTLIFPSDLNLWWHHALAADYATKFPALLVAVALLVVALLTLRAAWRRTRRPRDSPAP